MPILLKTHTVFNPHTYRETSMTKQFRHFKSAREFVISLKLKGKKESFYTEAKASKNIKSNEKYYTLKDVGILK